MLKGRFGNTTGRPYLEGLVTLKEQNLSGGVSFLVDTGADRTVLMSDDWEIMKVNFGQLTERIEFGGIGGPVSFSEAPLFLAFYDVGRKLYVYSLVIGVAPPESIYRGTPSILGRDILDRWEMLYSPTRKILSFEPLSSDFEFDLP